MTQTQEKVYQPETIVVMRQALDEAWAALSSDERQRTSKTELALRILELATRGERDPRRLRALAIGGVK
jgi:hypothetical protein